MSVSAWYTPGPLLFRRGSSGDSAPLVRPQPEAPAVSAGGARSPLTPDPPGRCSRPRSAPRASSRRAAALQSWEHSGRWLCSLLGQPVAFPARCGHRCHPPPPLQHCSQGSNRSEQCFDTSATCFVWLGQSHRGAVVAQIPFVHLRCTPQTQRCQNSCPGDQEHSWEMPLTGCTDCLLKSPKTAGNPHSQRGKTWQESRGWQEQ